jgi:hypothetical protein
MSWFGRSLLASVIALGLSVPAFAQPKADAGSGPTTGAATANDAGSGPTKGATPNTASNSNASDNSAGVTPGPKSTGGAQPVTPATPEKK